MQKLLKWSIIVVVIFLIAKLSTYWLPLLKIIGQALIPFAVAGFITYLLHPVIEWLYKKNYPRWLAILLIYTLFFGGIGYLVYQSIPVAMKQMEQFNKDIPELVDQYEAWTTKIHDGTEHFPTIIHEKVEQSIREVEKYVSVFISTIFDGAKSSLTSMMVLIMIPFITFYMLKDFKDIKKALVHITPERWHEPGAAFFHDVDGTLGGYIRGQLLIGAIIGSIATVGFWFMGMDYSLLLGVIIGITDFIPFFGPLIGSLPALLLAATISWKMLLFVAIFILVIQFLEGNILSPFIVGKSLHMHPIIIMLALVLGEELFGFVGLIIGIPLWAVLTIFIVHLKKYIVAKRYSVDK